MEGTTATALLSLNNVLQLHCLTTSTVGYHFLSYFLTLQKRAVTAYCGINSLEQNPKTPCSQMQLYEDYEKVEKPGQKPKNTIKLEEAKIDSSYSNPSSAYSSTISSPHGGVRLSVSPSGYSSSGSGSGVVGSGSGSGTVSSGVHMFSVTTKSGEVHEFRTETENERLRWVKLLQLLVMFPRSSIPEEPKSNPIKDTFRLRLEAVQYGASKSLSTTINFIPFIFKSALCNFPVYLVQCLFIDDIGSHLSGVDVSFCWRIVH